MQSVHTVAHNQSKKFNCNKSSAVVGQSGMTYVEEKALYITTQVSLSSRNFHNSEIHDPELK